VEPHWVVVLVAILLAPGVALGQVVTHALTGLAIHGYDPVAYFTEGKALPGVAQAEARLNGVVWRFRNEGNRQAFLANPETYAPQFGGYDPTELARGKAVAGHPQVWQVNAGRLYLFYDENSRAGFAANPAPLLAEAQHRWPAVRAELPSSP
jgi:YHS domain-containing protein